MLLECNIPGRTRGYVKFKQLDVYPRTTGTQSGTHKQDRVTKLAGKLLAAYYSIDSQPSNIK
jgi:hypothetical protein